MIPKFRAWDKNKKWMVHDVQDAYDGMYSQRNSDEINDYYGYASNFQSFTDEEEFNFMQSTGLKDKNGVEIYEGDVLKFTLQESPEGYFKETHHVESVEYSEGAFWVGHILFAHVAADGEEFEVVGNKFEHPHLLEGVDE